MIIKDILRQVKLTTLFFMKNLTFLLFLFCYSSLYGQSYIVKNLGIEQGLSNNYVVNIEQDKLGFMWFATEEGLNMFDGTNFRSFYKESGNDISLSGNELNDLFADPVDSILWIATQRAGLNAYDYSKNIFYTYKNIPNNPNSIITNDITKITPSADGNIWVCTYWRGIDYFDKKSKIFTHYNKSTVTGLPSNNVWCALDDYNGNLYIGHVKDGLSILNLATHNIKNFRCNKKDANSIPADEVTCIYKDKLNNIWVGTSKGVALYNPQEENFMIVKDVDNKLSHKVYSIKQTNDNKLWIAMEQGGIAILDLTKYLFSSKRETAITYINEGDENCGLSGNSIRTLFQDSYGNMWIGGWGNGIDFIAHETPLFNRLKYTPKLYTNSLTNKTASTICIDKSGQLWVGTDGGGINLFHKGQRINVYKTDKYINKNNYIQASLCDSKGDLWFGLFYGGVLYFNSTSKKFERITLDKKEPYNRDVRTFFEDKNGFIWVGTSQGIYVVERDSKRVIKHYSLKNNLVRAIHIDSKERVWIGFFGDGVALYSPKMKHLATFDVGNKFPSNTVNTIVDDSHNNIWIGTGEGAVKFENSSLDKYTIFNRDNGLENSHIFAITEDNEKNIWLSTNHGISCLNENGNIIYNYGLRDNIPLGSFCSSSVAKDRDNNIYFGSINGVCFFNPNNVLKKRISPKVHINTLEIEGMMYDDLHNTNKMNVIGEKEVHLNHKQNSFKITFNIPNYALSSRVDYAYQLKGLSDSWFTIKEGNSVSIRDLAHGNYKFNVKSRLNNQEWSDEISSLDIHIAPPIWLTWWAKLIYIIAILLFVLFFIKLYKKRLDVEALYKLEKKMREQEQELNDERLRFYTNITHELRTPLTLITAPLEDLTQNRSLSSSDLSKVKVIHKSALKLLDLINKLLEFRKVETHNKKLCVEKSNIVPQIKDICQKYKSLNVNPNVEINCNIPENDITLYYDKEVIQTILDNLISNALKYTDRGSVTIGLNMKEEKDDKVVEIWVSDTGCGIGEDALPHIFDRYYQEKRNSMAAGTGIGLSLVKRVVELHEGKISVQSKENVGTTFCITLSTENIYGSALHIESEKKGDYQFKNITIEPSNSDKNILLIVEDNKEIAEYIAETFKEKFDIHIAMNGQQGKEMALNIIPDIIISDIMMPIMDGNSMCSYLKNDMRTSHIPIILLTAKDSLKDKEEGYNVGADSYLTKPFSSNLLKSRIDNLLSSRKKLASYYKNSINNNNNIEDEGNVEVVQQETIYNVLDNEFIEKINRIINENFESEKMDIAFLADKMCMSNSTLYRKMKALTGLSTNEYIRKMKMKHAKKLLLEGKYNISEISLRIGFNNIFYFRQCFKEEFGTTPSEYLKKAKENIKSSN